MVTISYEKFSIRGVWVDKKVGEVILSFREIELSYDLQKEIQECHTFSRNSSKVFIANMKGVYIDSKLDQICTFQVKWPYGLLFSIPSFFAWIRFLFNFNKFNSSFHLKSWLLFISFRIKIKQNFFLPYILGNFLLFPVQ